MENKFKAKEIFIVVALILFLIPGICATYSGIRHAVEKFSNPDEKNQEVLFAEEFPFAGADTNFTTADESTLLSKYLDFSNKLTNYIDKYSGKNNIISPFFLNIYGKTTTSLGKKFIDDTESSVIKLANGYLTYVYLYSQKSIEDTAVLEFNEWLTKKNIPFLFVMPAEKSDDRYAVFPKGFPKVYAEKENEYLNYLYDNDVSFLNTSELLVFENKDFYSWFYKTDHHWNVHAGFSVAKSISQKLKTEFGLPVNTEVLNKTNFNTITYENIFLGSQGKKATYGYISPESFEVFYPIFDTIFSIEIPTMMINRTDTFENTLIESEALRADNIYTNNAYAAFLYGDIPLIRIHNLNCKNGTRALMIKTSDANVVDTYLAFTVEYLDIIDPRHFDGSIRAFIEKNHPDVVMTCTFPSKELDNKMLDIK